MYVIDSQHKNKHLYEYEKYTITYIIHIHYVYNIVITMATNRTNGYSYNRFIHFLIRLYKL